MDSRKRKLATNDNHLGSLETGRKREIRQHKRAKISEDTVGELSLAKRDDHERKPSFDDVSAVVQYKSGMDEDMKTTRDKRDPARGKRNNLDGDVQDPEQTASKIAVNMEHLCASGVSELFLLKKTGSGPSIMLMKVAHELANNMQTQVLTGRSYRRTKNMLIPEVERAIQANKRTSESLLQRMKAEVKLRGERKPTPKEDCVVQRILNEARDLDAKTKKMEAEKKILERDVEYDRRTWENAALLVEETLQKVFVQCGLIDEARVADNAMTTPQDDKSKHTKPSLEEGQPDTKPAVIGRLDSSRVRIKLEETKTRIELRKAQRKHDDHRNTFRRGLLAALAAAAHDRPDAPKRLIEEEFSRDYVRAGTELAGLVTRAQVAREAVLVAAAEADVSIIGSDDDMEPNFPYDLEELAAVKQKCLDRDAVQEWIEAIEASPKHNLRPLGYVLHMAEKWKRAAEEDGDVSSSGEDIMPNAGVETCRETPPTQNSVLKLALKSKSWHTEPYWSFSDCAEGKKRRRIDDWARRIQQPVG